MEVLPWILCIILVIIIIVSWIKIASLYRAAGELGTMFEERLEEDTNTGIFLSVRDKRMRRFAAVLDRQLKRLRKEHIRYVRGDMELKAAVTNISHDLRTPLTAVCGYLELLKGELKKGNEDGMADEYLAVMENRVLALKELMEEFFQYSAAVSKETYAEREELSLNAVVEESIAGYYGAFKEAGIEPEIELPEKEVVRCLNRQALSRILSNLIGNAIKYSGGDFFIRLTDNGELHFINTAPGMDRTEAGRIFERFYTGAQFESSFQTVYSGQIPGADCDNAAGAMLGNACQTAALGKTQAGLRFYTGYKNAMGLGLSIAKALTEKMGGQIAADCEDGRLHIILTF